MRQDPLTIIEAVIANGRNTTGALNSYQYAIQATRCVLLLPNPNSIHSHRLLSLAVGI